MTNQEIYNYYLDRADENFKEKNTAIGDICYGIGIGYEMSADMLANVNPDILRRKSLRQIYNEEYTFEDQLNESQIKEAV